MRPEGCFVAQLFVQSAIMDDDSDWEPEDSAAVDPGTDYGSAWEADSDYESDVGPALNQVWDAPDIGAALGGAATPQVRVTAGTPTCIAVAPFRRGNRGVTLLQSQLCRQNGRGFVCRASSHSRCCATNGGMHGRQMLHRLAPTLRCPATARWSLMAMGSRARRQGVGKASADGVAMGALPGRPRPPCACHSATWQRTLCHRSLFTALTRCQKVGRTCVRNSANAAATCRRRARKRKPTHISRGSMPPQGAHLLSLANSRLVAGELLDAQQLLLDCIKLYPNFTEPYMSLVAVVKELGQDTKALHLYALALHMKPSDSTIALECAKLSTGALRPRGCSDDPSAALHDVARVARLGF